MARQAEKRVVRRSTRNAPPAATRRARTGYVRKNRRRTAEVNGLEEVIRNLESQIARLTSGQTIHSTMSHASDQVGDVVSRASHHVGEMVADKLTNVAGRLLNGATSVTGAGRAGSGALQRIGNELERRPLMTVAIALGIGFLAGLAGRRE